MALLSSDLAAVVETASGRCICAVEVSCCCGVATESFRTAVLCLANKAQTAVEPSVRTCCIRQQSLRRDLTSLPSPEIHIGVTR